MDLGTIASVVRRVGPSLDARSGGERIALNLRTLLPLLEAQGRLAGAPSQLVADLRSIAAAGDAATLVLPPGAGAARIDADLRQLAIPATLRDALLALLDRAGAAAPAAATRATLAPATAAPAEAAAAARAWAVSAQASAAAAVALAGSGSARAVGRSIENDRPASPVAFTQPLIEAPQPTAPVGAIAERLRSTLERSGLFFESHLAQWTRGERSDESLARELLQSNPGDAHSAPSAAPAARIAAQLDALRHQAVLLHGPAWPGQAATIEIARERSGGASAASGDAPATVFDATLALDLPQLGRLVARLRLAGTTVAATFETMHADALSAALPEFRANLEAHGLTPVLLQAVDAHEATPSPRLPEEACLEQSRRGGGEG